MSFVPSGTPCDYAKVKRTKAYRLFKHVVFDGKKKSECGQNIEKRVMLEALRGEINAFRFTGPLWGQPSTTDGFVSTEQAVEQIVDLPVS